MAATAVFTSRGSCGSAQTGKNNRLGLKGTKSRLLPQLDKMPEAPVTMVILGGDDYHPEPQWTAKAIDRGRAAVRALS